MLKQSISATLLAGLMLLGSQRATFYNQNFNGSNTNPCLVSGWPMNEGSGLTSASTPAGNTVTYTNSGTLTWTANAIKSGESAPVFSGTGNGLSTNTSLASFSNTQPFSVAFWEKTTSTTSERFISTLNATGGSFQGWAVAFSGTGAASDLWFYLINTYPTNYLFVRTSSSSNVGDGNLHYIVVTYNGNSASTNGGVAMYIDAVFPVLGLQVNNNTLSATSAGATPVVMGNDYNVTTLGLVGTMGYAEVFNCALTSTQIGNYYSFGPGIY